MTATLADAPAKKKQEQPAEELAASNHPWDINPALVRRERFDRSVLVLPRTKTRVWPYLSCTYAASP